MTVRQKVGIMPLTGQTGLVCVWWIPARSREAYQSRLL